MQYNVTCGFMPHEEQCNRNGQCEGCEYAEPVKPAEKYACPLCGEVLHDEVGAPNFYCGKCQNFVEGVRS